MAYLQSTLKASNNNRPAAAKAHNDYKGPFLKEIKGAKSKELLIDDEDVQVLHGFATVADARACLRSRMLNDDVVKGLAPHLDADAEIRIYDLA